MGKGSTRSISYHGRCFISPCLFTACLLVAMLFASAHAKTADGKDLLQFTSKGHILGFSPGSMYMASGSHMLKVEFLGGKSVSPVSKEGPSSDGKAPPLSKVTYPNIWDGVDIVYEGAKGSIVKSTYTVAAGKAPGSIRLRYNRPLTLDEKGNLVVRYETGTITESKPIAWQVIEGKKKPVMVAYNLQSDKEVGFTAKDYDKSVPLVIDPDSGWTSMHFGGGSYYDWGQAIAVDSSGNIYVTGFSDGTWDSPVQAYTSGRDVFVAKLAADGSLIWNTFLGGSGNDWGCAIASDSSENVYVMGYSTAAWGNPLEAYRSANDVFVAKLAADGSLIWNTFLGGGGGDTGYGMAVDSEGSVYVARTGTATWGSPIRAYTSGNDAFVAKLTTDGSLIWNTFLGGSGSDTGCGLAVDSERSVYVTGGSSATWGSPIRAYTSGNDAFVAKLTTDGSLIWNTFLGGSGNDAGYGLAVDSERSVYVAGGSGATWGSPLGAYYGQGDDAFVAKLTTDGSFLWNTFLGGSGDNTAGAIAVDSGRNVYVTVSGYNDAFMAKLTTDGALVRNNGTAGSGIAIDSGRNIYVTGGIYVGFLGGYDILVIKQNLSSDTLSVLVDGSGSGLVTSDPSGITCGSVCSAVFAEGTSVTLTANPGAHSVFSGWGGACSGTGTCTFTLSAETTVRARFRIGTYAVTASVSGGHGAVSPATQAVSYGNSAIITMIPDDGYHIATLTDNGQEITGTAMGGKASRASNKKERVRSRIPVKKTPTTAVTSIPNPYMITGVTADHAVVVTYAIDSVTLTGSVAAGTGNGTLSAEGLTCSGSSCSGTYQYGTKVVITATPDPDSALESLSGCDSISGNTCTVAMTANRTVTAVFSSPCAYTISPSSKSFPHKGGSATITVKATGAKTCTTPTPSASDAWITTSMGSFANNKGTVRVTISANDSVTERTGAVTIRGNSFQVTQDGTPCTLTISSTGNTLSPAGGTDSFTVNAPTGCAWSVSSSEDWLTGITSAGTGTGPVSYTASENTTGKQRIGKITVFLTDTPTKKKVFTVKQSLCTLTTSSTGNTLSPVGGTDSFTVNAPTGCAWSVSSSEDWLTGITSAGTGTGPVSYTASENTTGKQRSGKITVFLTDTPTKKKVFTVTEKK